MPQSGGAEDDLATKAPGSARQQALALLARKQHAKAALGRALAQKGHAPGEIDEALAAVQAWGYLNDSRLADAIGHAAVRRGKGARWVEATLAERQVEPSERRAVLAQAQAREAEQAWQVLQQRARRWPSPPDPALLARASRFLLARGFCSTHVRNAIERWRGAQASQPNA